MKAIDKVREIKKSKVKFLTTFDAKLLKDIKVLAAQENKKINSVMEEAFNMLLKSKNNQ